MSIKKSLRLSIMLLAIIPVLLLTIISYIIITYKYNDINKELIHSTVSTYREGIEAELDTLIIDSSSISDNLEVKSYLLKKFNNPSLNLVTSDSSYESINAMLIQSSNNFNENVNYYIYDYTGCIVGASTNKASGVTDALIKSYIDSVKEATVISSEEDYITIVSPVIVKEETIGLVKLEVYPEYFGPFISTSQSDSNYFLMDATNGNIIFSPEITVQDFDQLSKSLTSIAQDYNSGSGDENGSYINSGLYGGTVYGYSILSKYNWIYVINQDSKVYSSLFYTLIPFLILSLVVILFVSLNVSSHLVKKYTNPIFKLKSKMLEASNGKLDVKCDINTDDEFGELSLMFNSMMDIISSNYNAIEAVQKELVSHEEELKKNYTHIEHLAYTDGLTGLSNRVAFMQESYNILHSPTGQIGKHAVLFIDLDNFKNVNDTLGHDYGDLLLIQVSQTLKSLVGENDVLARTGGDEFLVLKKDYESDEELEAFAGNLVTISSQPFILEDEKVHISMSLGISKFPQNGLTINELIKNADIAMYSAKTSGKNNYRFFNGMMEDEVNRRNEIADVLREAISNNDVFLVFQPQANISNGKVTGFEALMRLQSPNIGYVRPDEFIPIAEDIGLISELGDWAIRETCIFSKRLIELGFPPLTSSVNISTTQLTGNRLLKTIRQTLAETEFPPELLEIELTESVLMHSIEHNLFLINEIKKLGARIALDDFGTGYSSFNYLTRLPINTLKIDKSFINGICLSEKDRYISSTIISLAHNLEISVVAEGVEDVPQLKILQDQNCDTLQGYLFSKPLTADEFIQLLKDNI